MAEQVLDLERKVQAPVLKFFKNQVPKAFEDVLNFERKIQKEIVNLFKNDVEPPPPVEPPTAAPVQGVNVVLSPIEVNGFYLLSGGDYVTFYATTLNQKREYIKEGWTVSGMTGMSGQLAVMPEGADFNLDMGSRTAPISATTSEPYIWSFRIQSDTEQSIAPYQAVTGAILYPPSQIDYTAMKRQGPINGNYTVTRNVLQFNFTDPPPSGFGPGWTVENLTGLQPKFRVVSYTDESRYVTAPKTFSQGKFTSAGDTYFQVIGFAILEPLDGTVPENTVRPINSTGLVKEPGFLSTFVPAKFTNFETGASTQKFNIEINESVRGGASSFQLRDLNTGFKYEALETGPFEDVKGRGFSSASVLALNAIGPQEDHLLLEDFTKSQWNPDFKRYTNSVMYQRVIPLPPPNPSYHNQTIQLELLPTELGHLLSNMYLKVTMPALPPGSQYSAQLGRALIKQVDLLVNETVIETLYDDWYIIRDQIFLDADEQTGMFQAVGGSNINSQVATDYIIPLEFFFCRRKSHNDQDDERLRRPYFPLCAMWNQRLYVRFTFQPNTWWCNVAAPHTTDLVLPKLVTEEILLENAEKLYYTNTPLKYIVNRVKRESTLTFSAGNPQLQLTASFPVQTLAWFFRNKNYEDVSSGLYSDSRYNYGYTTQYIQTGVQLNFPSGVSNYVDVIDTAKITLNNVDILSTFQGSLYYTFKQPLEHGLSIPSKSIYSYSFGLTPREYNQGGYLNFSKLNSQTTTLTLVFNPSYATQISQGYNLYLFYYGYTLLEFQGGFARLPYV
jgi:hypothetical protein